MNRSALLLGVLLHPALVWAEGGYGIVVRGGRDGALPEESATSSVSRADLSRRQPRSAPDALRFEPGVFVQQTAHGQGSAYIRGLTGQQTVLLFDGIRINNSTFRQGPNQYFFTVDSRTIDAIEVLRGGASMRYGSDALGGVVAAYPTEPFVVTQGVSVRPRLLGRFTTADTEKGGRADLMLSTALPRGVVLSFFGGAGGRDVGFLESGGRLENPTVHPALPRYPEVPRYASDGRTQLGTGFREISADGRLVLRFGGRHRLTLASYHYMQLDTPRTDQCPPPAAQSNVCQIYDQQFRHLSYVAWDADIGGQRLRVTVSHQRQHERLRHEDPNIFVRFIGEDDVDTLGASLQGSTKVERIRLMLGYGADAYLDLLESRMTRYFTDVDVPPREQTRGQYVGKSLYAQGGAFIDGAFALPRGFIVRAGARLGFALAHAPGDEASGSSPVDANWIPVVGRAGLEWRPHASLSLRLNIDHSFRAPNLNDLTARQTTGPGFQFENAGLRPERATTFELGAVFEHRYVSAQLWGYETLLTDMVLKVARGLGDCPPATPQCLGSWSRFQLMNAEEWSEIRGMEGLLKLTPVRWFFARATLSYTWGEGPRLGNTAQGVVGVMLEDRVPLSRIPPFNGTVELGLAPWAILEISAGLRWATAQDRLAIADYSDARIPKYGTPGFAVLDVHASVRPDPHLTFGCVFENVFDSPYRYHGSSINGPGRGFILSMRVQ